MHADEMSPVAFYATVNLIRDHEKELKVVEQIVKSIDDGGARLDDLVASLARANQDLVREMRGSTKRRDAFSSKDDEEDWLSDLRGSAHGSYFLPVVFGVMGKLQAALRDLRSTASSLRCPVLTLPSGKLEMPKAFTADEIQRVDFEVRLNRHLVTKFVHAVERAATARSVVLDAGDYAARTLDDYHRVLTKRHSVDGVRIFRDPVATDVAFSIFENVDAHGELADGKKPDEISVHSVNKAVVLVDAVVHGAIGVYVRDPSLVLALIGGTLKHLWIAASALEDLACPVDDAVREVLGATHRHDQEFSDDDFDHATAALEDLDPRDVTFREKTGLMTSEERHALDFRNATLETVVGMLTAEDISPRGVVDYILARKAELHAHFRDENSFYVCRVGAGNPFLGSAPGALEVVPSTRPNVDLDWILGSGFGEVRSFLGQVESATKWHDLFVATSPSKTADKANVLLVGPPGCGKSEVLRAVGGDKRSIGIFAQGSDFMTCWKGEAEKNPKRLFEAGLKLQKECGRRVYFLIDEIDTVLHAKSSRDAFGDTNLTTEFQILMDGIIHYPRLSVWGATNFPDRIPMAMIRRFSKVLIVGELTQDDRVKLLMHFVGDHMPSRIADEVWETQARRLEGATGDVVRKVADHVWRSTMSGFVREYPSAAEELVKSLAPAGTSFSVGRFSAKQRADFLDVLGGYVWVGGCELEAAVTACLGDVAIRHEIATAVETYAKAKAFLGTTKFDGG